MIFKIRDVKNRIKNNNNFPCRCGFKNDSFNDEVIPFSLLSSHPSNTKRHHSIRPANQGTRCPLTSHPVNTLGLVRRPSWQRLAEPLAGSLPAGCDEEPSEPVRPSAGGPSARTEPNRWPAGGPRTSPRDPGTRTTGPTGAPRRASRLS